ncbi:tyrosine-protein kinase family protein [Candidatus Lokiarchaeum ossiferum]|uniref:tyrosine-protein kinase family protein n=1 Tax=Candidatus Lokiarchaeum ossiferum TaxID=2951803 RepID=UPI00352C6689
MKRITVHSFRGGTGKSLIALNLATNLTNKNKRVLLIETDISMPSFIEILKVNPKFTFNDYYEGNCDLSKAISKTNHGFSVICCGYNFSLNDKVFSVDQSYHGKRLKLFLGDLRNLSSQFDYCIIDSSPGWGFIQINNGLIANKIVLILRAELNNFKGTLKMVQDVYQKTFALGKEFAVFWNQIPNVDAMGGLISNWEKKFSSEMKIANFLYMNYYDEIAFNIAQGKHILKDNAIFQKNISQLTDFCFT